MIKLLATRMFYVKLIKILREEFNEEITYDNIQHIQFGLDTIKIKFKNNSIIKLISYRDFIKYNL